MSHSQIELRGRSALSFDDPRGHAHALQPSPAAALKAEQISVRQSRWTRCRCKNQGFEAHLFVVLGFAKLAESG